MIGFTKFDNAVFEKILVSDFTKRQLKILLLVVRFSAGYHKAAATLRMRDFGYARLTSYCIRRELRTLEEMDVLRLDEATHSIWLNPLLAAWRVPSLPDARMRFARIAVENSPHRQPGAVRADSGGPARTAAQEKENQETAKTGSLLDLIVERDLEGVVGPLSPVQRRQFGYVAQRHGAVRVRAAIRIARVRAVHDFPGFLRLLEGLGSH